MSRIEVDDDFQKSSSKGSVDDVEMHRLMIIEAFRTCCELRRCYGLDRADMGQESSAVLTYS